MARPIEPMPPLQREDAEIVELARGQHMSAADWEEQRRCFAYGNVAIENPRVTREMIDEAAAAPLPAGSFR